MPTSNDQQTKMLAEIVDQLDEIKDRLSRLEEIKESLVVLNDTLAENLESLPMALAAIATILDKQNE